MILEKLSGDEMSHIAKVWKFGNDIDTDQIMPSQYLVLHSMSEMLKHTMEPLDFEFHEKYCCGDIIVAGKNFGCGSSREQAPAALKELGVKYIIAESFARIFYRNAINIGLFPVELADTSEFKTGDDVEIDIVSSKIHNRQNGRSYNVMPCSDFMSKIIECGGLVKYVRETMVSDRSKVLP